LLNYKDIIVTTMKAFPPKWRGYFAHTEPFSCLCDWGGGSLYWNSHKLFIHLQIGAGICTILTGETSWLAKSII